MKPTFWPFSAESRGHQEPSWLCPTHAVAPPRGWRCPAPRLPRPTAGGHVLGPRTCVRPDALSSRAPSTPHFTHRDNSAAAPHVHRVTGHGAPPAEPPLVAGLSCHCNGTRHDYDAYNHAPHLGNTRPTVRPVRKPVRRLSLCSAVVEYTSATTAGRVRPLPRGSNGPDLFHRGRASRTPSAGVGRVGPLPQRSGESDPFRRGRTRRTSSAEVGRGGSFMRAPTGPFSFGPTSIVMPPKLSPWGFSE
jgi:hypothetical protein